MRVNQKGQAVLIVLLTMVVALTVVLSIVSSSSSDIKLSTLENSSQRAFSAAEAGAERALIAGTGGTGSVNTGATYNANVSGLAENSTRYIYPATLNNGESGVFWLVEHASDKSLTCNGNCFTGNRANICWGVPGALADVSLPTTPAMEISVFYLATPGNYSSGRVVKEIYDPNTARRTASSYAAPTATNCSIDGTTFAFQANVAFNLLGVNSSVTAFQNGLQFISVKPLYNTVPQPVGINVSMAGNTDLPAQGQRVDSSGTLDVATRRVEVSRSFGSIPGPFDAAIFSGGNL